MLWETCGVTGGGDLGRGPYSMVGPASAVAGLVLAAAAPLFSGASWRPKEARRVVLALEGEAGQQPVGVGGINPVDFVLVLAHPGS